MKKSGNKCFCQRVIKYLISLFKIGKLAHTLQDRLFIFTRLSTKIDLNIPGLLKANNNRMPWHIET